MSARAGTRSRPPKPTAASSRVSATRSTTRTPDAIRAGGSSKATWPSRAEPEDRQVDRRRLEHGLVAGGLGSQVGRRAVDRAQRRERHAAELLAQLRGEAARVCRPEAGVLVELQHGRPLAGAGCRRPRGRAAPRTCPAATARSAAAAARRAGGEPVDHELGGEGRPARRGSSSTSGAGAAGTWSSVPRRPVTSRANETTEWCTADRPTRSCLPRREPTATRSRSSTTATRARCWRTSRRAWEAGSTSARESPAETFACALEGLRRYRPGRGSPSAWLYGASRAIRSRARSSGAAWSGGHYRLRLGVADIHLDDDEIERLEDIVAGEEGGRTGGRSADRRRCPTDQRESLEARIVHDRSYEAIAGDAGTTAAAARKRVSRGAGHLANEAGNGNL